MKREFFLAITTELAAVTTDLVGALSYSNPIVASKFRNLSTGFNRTWSVSTYIPPYSGTKSKCKLAQVMKVILWRT